MTEPAYTLFDVRDYPIVRFVGVAAEGYAPRWCEEMDQLLADGRRFVLIYPPRRDEEAHADRVARGQWLKHNKAALAERCLAVIGIEPDAARRAEMEAMHANLVRAFGTPQATRGTAAQADALARHLLAGGAPTDAA